MTEITPIEHAIAEYWGRRCEIFEADCFCCQAWKQYDELIAAQKRIKEADESEILLAKHDKPSEPGWYLYDTEHGATGCFYWTGSSCANHHGGGESWDFDEFFEPVEVANFRRLVESERDGND